jgi:hypothetical protein
MGERETTVRTAVVTYFPMFIAALSLLTSVYNGYLNGKFVDIIQSNLGRGEYMRTCKEIIDGYFQVKFRTGLLSSDSEHAGGASVPATPQLQVEAANAVNHFAALGTYLANLRDERTRVRYTQLSEQLNMIAKQASRASSAELQKMFEPADRMFYEMNNDCVKSAKAAP